MNPKIMMKVLAYPNFALALSSKGLMTASKTINTTIVPKMPKVDPAALPISYLAFPFTVDATTLGKRAAIMPIIMTEMMKELMTADLDCV